MTYGLSAQADISAHGIRYDNNFGSTFTVWRGTDVVGEINLRVPGLHNVYNSLAAIAVGFELDVPFEQIVEGAWTASPAREDVFSRKVRWEECWSLMTTAIIRPRSGQRWRQRSSDPADGASSCLFQPHRYSRTHDLMEEFARSFNNADFLFITDIYAASEEPIEGVTAEALTEAIKRFGHKDVNYIGALENAAASLCEITFSRAISC